MDPQEHQHSETLVPETRFVEEQGQSGEGGGALPNRMAVSQKDEPLTRPPRSETEPFVGT